MIHNELIESLKSKVLEGGEISDTDAYALADSLPASSKLLRKAAAEITSHLCSPTFDLCSIVNARSGLCGENCKWCAQSKYYSTGCETYDLVDHDECMAAARDCSLKGIRRFSLVASGRAVKGNALKSICALLNEAAAETGISTCASLGLLDRNDLQQLWDAGVRRYHCNLETSASYFPTLCTTHTREDKLRTIRMAREVGMEVCSGGIIGMGETLAQRLELAAESRDAGAISIPVNLLNPIKGTPLENTPLISEPEVVLTIALMRLVAPKQTIRFAGGRARMSADATARMLRGGANGAIVGDMLTTIGNAMEEDRKLFTSVGLKI